MHGIYDLGLEKFPEGKKMERHWTKITKKVMLSSWADYMNRLKERSIYITVLKARLKLLYICMIILTPRKMINIVGISMEMINFIERMLN